MEVITESFAALFLTVDSLADKQTALATYRMFLREHDVVAHRNENFTTSCTFSIYIGFIIGIA